MFISQKDRYHCLLLQSSPKKLILTLDSMWGRSFLNTTSPPPPPPPASNAMTAVGCHTVQLSSNSIYPKTASDASGEGFSPTRLPHFGCRSQVQAVNCASEQMAINQRFTWPLPWVWLNLFKWLTELRKPVYSLDYLFITGYGRVWLSSQIKRGIGWDPDEHKSICPEWWQVGSILAPQTENSPNHFLWAIYGGFIS